MSNVRQPVIVLVGPKPARKAVRRVFARYEIVERPQWSALPSGPAVCVDARRFVSLSPGAIEKLAGAVAGGALLAVPASNVNRWPLCGLQPPLSGASRQDVARHVARIANEPTTQLAIVDVALSLLDEDATGACQPGPELSRQFASGAAVDHGSVLPPVFAVPDASALPARPRRIADVASEVSLVASAWCPDDTSVMVSAAFIARDEEQTIAAAIESVRGLVDEVVVYDTGSCDATVAVASYAGAVVRQGVWVDDFAAARNEALAMCRGTWVVTVDCDERVELDLGVDPVSFGRQLATVREPAVFELELVNADTSGRRVSAPVPSRRVLHRSMRWKNRIHEVIVAADGSVPFEAGRLAGATIVHVGYARERGRRVAQNLALAELRNAEDGDEMASFELARAALVAGQVDAAAARFAAVAESSPGSHAGVLATLFLAIALAGTSRRGEVRGLLDPLMLSSGAEAAAARWIAAGASDNMSDALALLDGVDEVAFFHIAASRAEVAAYRAFLAASCGQFERVVDELAVEGVCAAEASWWAAAVAASAGEFTPAVRLASAVAGTHISSGGVSAGLARAVATLAGGPAPGAYEVVSVLVERFGAEAPLVAFLVSGSPRGGFLAACDARVRLAELGVSHVGDPLVRLITDGHGDVADRFLAGVLLDDLAVACPSGGSWSALLALDVPQGHVDAVLAVVDDLLPELTETARRALVG